MIQDSILESKEVAHKSSRQERDKTEHAAEMRKREWKHIHQDHFKSIAFVRSMGEYIKEVGLEFFLKKKIID